MAEKNYGSTRIVVGAHYGLRDWLAQRITALLMALFTISMGASGMAYLLEPEEQSIQPR